MLQQRFSISTDPAKLDLVTIHNFLKQSYWAKNISLATVQKSLENSLCFGVYEGSQQVGLARVITDYTTFAYLTDVFILESHRSQGLGKWLVEYIVNFPELQDLRRWLLVTNDAHGLYCQYGFQTVQQPELLMEIFNPDFDEPKQEV